MSATDKNEDSIHYITETQYFLRGGVLVNNSFSLRIHVFHLPTFLFLQEVDSSLQNGGLVHLARMALTLQHGA